MRHEMRPGALALLRGGEGNTFPATRLRRLRRTETLRSLVREHRVVAEDLILPIFVDEAADEAQPIAVHAWRLAASRSSASRTRWRRSPATACAR